MGPLGPLGPTWAHLGPLGTPLGPLGALWGQNPALAWLAFAAAVVVAGPGQGKAGMTGPGQIRPRQGTTGKPAKPEQDLGVA